MHESASTNKIKYWKLFISAVSTADVILQQSMRLEHNHILQAGKQEGSTVSVTT